MTCTNGEHIILAQLGNYNKPLANSRPRVLCFSGTDHHHPIPNTKTHSLRADLKNGTIEEVKKRKPGDIGIEMFQHGGRHLERVTKEQALSKYPGRREDAERSLVITIAHAHRSIAHLTEGPIEDPGSIDLLILGAKGVLALVHNFLYVRLGIPTPDDSIKQIKP